MYVVIELTNLHFITHINCIYLEVRTVFINFQTVPAPKSIEHNSLFKY